MVKNNLDRHRSRYIRPYLRKVQTCRFCICDRGDQIVQFKAIISTKKLDRLTTWIQSKSLLHSVDILSLLYLKIEDCFSPDCRNRDHLSIQRLSQRRSSNRCIWRHLLHSHWSTCSCHGLFHLDVSSDRKVSKSYIKSSDFYSGCKTLIF